MIKTHSGSDMPWLKQIIGLIGWLAVTFVTAALGAMASAQASTFYRTLELPTWAPPAWLFGPVWSALYLMMAIAAWLVWRTYGFRHAGPALTLFLVHLVANALWSWLFFSWQLGALAFVEILVLWAMIAALIVAFWRLNKIAALLLTPYLAWVSFAAVLNFATWQLNPGIL